MKTTYTPGPWRIGEDDVIVAGPRGLHIAKVEITGMGYAADANARLIAAAPELLACLDCLVSVCENEGFPFLGLILPKAREAIAKATNA
jgi:hypothetical protein